MTFRQAQGTEVQITLQESTRAFVRREVVPHLQEWEDAGEVPRVAAPRCREGRACSGLGFPEEVGGQGGTLLDSVAMQEAFFEAGGSSGLAAALFTGGIALPHIAAHGTPEQVDAFVRPDARRREDRRARGDRAGRRLRRRGHHAPRPCAMATATSSTAPRRSSRAGCVPTSSPPRCAPATPATRGAPGISLLVVEKGTPGFTVDRSLCRRWAGTARTPPSSPSSTCASPRATSSARENSGFAMIAEQFVVERIALAVHAYGIAARSLALTASYCRERETFGKPLVANQVVRHRLVEMHRQVEVARTYTRDGRRAPRRRRLPSSPRPAWPSRPRSRRAPTSSTRPCSCTAAPATCTAPRWSGTTATPGSSASAAEPPRCSPTCPHDCWDTPP